MNFRISNSLFESIRNVTNPQVEEPAKVEEAEVDKAHFCATHVEHAMLGLGTCISEQHAEPDEQGQIAWYTVEFPTGTHRIETSNLKIVEGKSHSHSKKMAEAEEKIDEKKLHPNQQVLDVHEPEKDKLTSKDFEMLRAGKKQKSVKEASATGPGSTFDWRNTPRETLKPGERAGFDSKKISTGTVYTRKVTKEKPEPAGKTFKPKAVKEGISQTIINYDDFRIDVTDNPTYGDYLRALQTMVESRDENIQQEVVAIATAAYNDKIDSIIIESKARQIFADKLDEIRKSGSTVLDESYIVESNSTYVEYTVEKDGVRTQYVHIGTNGNK
jgi:hypothetical protein